jgi:hypothetical protein
MTGTTNNPGLGHENGAVETSHDSLKHRLDQAIKLRGSADFTSVADYQALINRSANRLIRHTLTRLEKEQKHLRPLPKYCFMDYAELSAKDTSSSTIVVKRGLYPVLSPLIGETLRIDYRHVIHALAAKPQAFRFSNFCDDLFPNDNYRQL